MHEKTFLYCPWCGSRNIKTHTIQTSGGLFQRKWQCPDCDFDLYNNVASAVGLLIVNHKNEVLFEKRAKEPRKGFLALPGGFCEQDESGEESARRECKEEIGVSPQNVRYLCSWPNTYYYKDVLYKTCDMFFTATLPEQYALTAQKGEVDGFVWYKIENRQDVEQCPLAFDSAKKTLLTWLSQK